MPTFDVCVCCGIFPRPREDHTFLNCYGSARGCDGYISAVMFHAAPNHITLFRRSELRKRMITRQNGVKLGGCSGPLRILRVANNYHKIGAGLSPSG